MTDFHARMILLQSRHLPGPTTASWGQVATAARQIAFAPYASRDTLRLARELRQMCEAQA